MKCNRLIRTNPILEGLRVEFTPDEARHIIASLQDRSCHPAVQKLILFLSTELAFTPETRFPSDVLNSKAES